MVKRYDWKYDGMDAYYLGAYVDYDDYVALEARLTSIISGLQLELDKHLKDKLADRHMQDMRNS